MEVTEALFAHQHLADTLISNKKIRKNICNLVAIFTYKSKMLCRISR